MNLTDNDKAAIIHVSIVSKHPHSAMIVKWLITGWDVVYKGQKDKLVHPCWAKDDDYELIEPKPAKPAYRVYIDIASGKPGMCSRGSDGVERSLPISDNFEWSGDWIEYDLPKKWPTPLVERIAAIDIKAAEWIVEHWDDLLDDKYTTGHSKKFSRSANRLNLMFRWNGSDLGGDYWYEISDKLGEQ